MRTLFGTLTIAVLLLFSVTAERALAHARLEAASPAPDAVVAPPSELRIWFTQELTLSGHDIVVTDAAGTRLDNADARVDQTDPNRKQLVVTLQPLPAGTYLVTYTARSADDGHDYTDSYSFSVDPAVQPAGAAPASTEPVQGRPAPSEAGSSRAAEAAGC
jgi:methionine-rich copper-binding protein CopC